MSARYAFNSFGKPHDPDVDVPRLLELSRQPLDTRTRLVHTTRKRVCRDADLIVVVLVTVMEASRLQLASGRLRQTGRMDVWTSQS